MMSLKHVVSLLLTAILSGVIIVQIVYAQGPTQRSTLQQIIDSGSIEAAISLDDKAFCAQSLITGEYTGFEPTLSVLLSKEAGADVETSFTSISGKTSEFEDNLRLLDEHKILMIVSIAFQKELKEKLSDRYQVSYPYYEDPLVLLVNKDSDMDYFPALSGRTVGVLEHTDHALKLVKRLIDTATIDVTDFNDSKFKLYAWRNGVRFITDTSYDRLFKDLKNNKISAVLGRKSILNSYINSDYKFMDEHFDVIEYGVISLKNTEFSSFVNKTIKRFANEGTLDRLLKENHI